MRSHQAIGNTGIFNLHLFAGTRSVLRYFQTEYKILITKPRITLTKSKRHQSICK
ncbi:hypothetical protein RHECNPAF_890011 [Rhizobium etli CNPAF512]|nr:hypothetical protein RHECNPAF_890011 [Rhizobium etli CNPAF512]